MIGAVTARVGEELLDAVAAGPGTRLLDVGCGPGTITAAAAARGADAVGVDLAVGMLALGRERHPGLELLEADAEALPFPDDAFDALVGGFVLNHLPAVETAVAEAARVLAAGRAHGGRGVGPAGPQPPARRADGRGPRRGRRRPRRPARRPRSLPAGRSGGDAGAARRVRAPRTRRRGRSCSCTRPPASTSCWDGLLGGTARISTVLAGLPEATRARVRDAFAERVAPAGGAVALRGGGDDRLRYVRLT